MGRTMKKTGKARGRVVRSLCQCGNLQRFVGYNYKGEKVYGLVCETCKKVGRRTKGPCCEMCGFIPKHPCQLDVDHKNGNPADNDPNNTQTLCSNCHRLKTYTNQEWKHKNAKKVS
jgi:hypothetical protein